MLALIAAILFDTSGPDRRIALELFEIGDLTVFVEDFPGSGSRVVPESPWGLRWAPNFVEGLRRYLGWRAAEERAGKSILFASGSLVVRASAKERGRVAAALREMRQDGVRLELYDVQDLTYSEPGFPGILDGERASMHPPGKIEGWTLAESIGRRFIPAGDTHRSCFFQNGLLIVRANPKEHARVDAWLSSLRVVSRLRPRFQRWP